MKQLDSLIRLHRWQLDEKRRTQAELQALADRIKGEIDRLQADLARERETASHTDGPALGIGPYIQSILARERHLSQTLDEIGRQIAAAHDAITESFRELKRYELAQEERLRAEARRLDRLERLNLDEVAATQFERRRSAADAE